MAGVQVAVGANSPYFFGKELWRETRIALFKQATDTRPDEMKAQGVRPRVWFGERWITASSTCSRRTCGTSRRCCRWCDDGGPGGGARARRTPALQELRLHNGTVWRWNRPVYDIVDGVPHLRVENRVLPAGPTVVDMLRQRGLLLGLVRALAEEDRPVWTRMSFGAAEDNFQPRARGLEAHRLLAGHGRVPVTELVLRRLLPRRTTG